MRFFTISGKISKNPEIIIIFIFDSEQENALLIKVWTILV